MKSVDWTLTGGVDRSARAGHDGAHAGILRAAAATTGNLDDLGDRALGVEVQQAHAGAQRQLIPKFGR